MYYRQLINKLFILVVFSLIGLFSPPSYSCLQPPSWAGTELYSQATINSRVISRAIVVYSEINTHWTYPKPGSKMDSASDLWDAKWMENKVVDSTGRTVKAHVPTLVHQGDISTFGDDLESLIRTDGAKLECTIALSTVKILCLRVLLGDYFKGYVEQVRGALLESDLSTDLLFDSLFAPFFNTFNGYKEIPGSFTYLTNVASYGLFKPRGNARGSNVVCTAVDQFLGFSGIYKGGPQALRTIEDQDLSLFCSTEDLEENRRAHRKLRRLYQLKPSKFYEQRALDQKAIQFYQIFDEELINDFRKWQLIDIIFE